MKNIYWKIYLLIQRIEMIYEIEVQINGKTYKRVDNYFSFYHKGELQNHVSSSYQVRLKNGCPCCNWRLLNQRCTKMIPLIDQQINVEYRNSL
jgi:hypothetical protein